jgi:hypothetical protein
MPSPFPGMDPFIECQKWRGIGGAKPNLSELQQAWVSDRIRNW